MSLRAPTLSACLLAAAGAAGAGSVQVEFVQPARYADIGDTPSETAHNLRELERYLQSLGGRYLPANARLKIEMLDVDLAGAMRPAAGPAQVRVITGSADYPRMRLRYTFTADGAERRGDERLADLDYTRGLANRGDSHALFYEKRMLHAWFKARFVAGRAD